MQQIAKFKHTPPHVREQLIRDIQQSTKSIQQACRDIGIDRQKYYRWLAKVPRPKPTNSILQHLYAERDRINEQIAIVERAERLGMKVLLN